MTAFNNLSDVLVAHKNPLPQGAQRLPWRIVQEQCTGTINALPSLWGRLVATNGILCAIWQSTPQRFVFGHLDWFVPDDHRNMGAVNAERKGQKTPEPKILVEYVV